MLRDVCEVTGRGPSNPLESDARCVYCKSPVFSVFQRVFLASVQSSFYIYTLQSIAMGRTIMCQCMLERNNLLPDFARCGFKILLSVSEETLHI